MGELAFLGGFHPPDRLDLAPPAAPAPTRGGGAAASAAAPPFWGPLLGPIRQVRGVWGAGAPQEGQFPQKFTTSCAGGPVLLVFLHLLFGELTGVIFKQIRPGTLRIWSGVKVSVGWCLPQVGRLESEQSSSIKYLLVENRWLSNLRAFFNIAIGLGR